MKKSERLRRHLKRLHQSGLHALANEARRIGVLNDLYDDFGDQHLAELREGHAQAALFEGFRADGYFAEAESYYFEGNPRRRIDLAVWLPDVRRWLYLEVKPCGPQGGGKKVLGDAKKLLADPSGDIRDQLRGVLAYGFQRPLEHGRDQYPDKYARLSGRLDKRGFKEIAIGRAELADTGFEYLQLGLWVRDGLRRGKAQETA